MIGDTKRNRNKPSDNTAKYVYTVYMQGGEEDDDNDDETIRARS